MAGLIFNITLLPDDLLFYILEHLDTDETIAFAYSCNRFRQFCQHNPRVLRKVDLSKCIVRRKEDPLTKAFFRDKQMVQNVRELNFNNHRVLNWQMDGYLEEFIIACRHQLEALHILNCGISLKSLHNILQQTTKLTVLSFSVMDLSQEDFAFVLNHRVHADKGIFLENIRSLHIETHYSTDHLQILKYLVAYCCKYLEELQIYVWSANFLCEVGTSIYSDLLYQVYRRTKKTLHHFHSLTLQIDYSPYKYYKLDISYFIASLIKMKSPRMNWKKLWISPPIDATKLLDKCGPDVISSVEALATKHVHFQTNDKDLFQMINDRVVSKLQVQFANFFNTLPKSIARIGGAALQCLSLSRTSQAQHESDVDDNIPLNVLFSSCCNITELDLSTCHFQNNICESLRNLRHLVKLDVMHCAIAPNVAEDRLNKGNRDLLCLVENCPNVTGFVVRGCNVEVCINQRSMPDDDMLPLAKWTKLESLTCINITFSLKQNDKKPRMEPKQDSTTFLDEIVDKCKFLATLRIEIQNHDVDAYINFLQSAKQLKHLVLDMDVEWESRGFWELLSCATNLERLCIRSFCGVLIDIPGAINMLNSLPQLYAFHIHFHAFEIDIERDGNIKSFYEHVVKVLEEKSGRFASFEFLVQELESYPDLYWVYKKVLPMNIGELCSYLPGMALPMV